MQVMVLWHFDHILASIVKVIRRENLVSEIVVVSEVPWRHLRLFHHCQILVLDGH